MNDEGQEVTQDVTQAAEEPAHAAKAETPPWEKPAAPAPQEKTAADEEAHRKARSGGFQRRIDELVREREYERAEKQKLLEVLSRQQPAQQPAAKQEAQTDTAPNIDNFDDYGKYMAAVARHEARQEHAELRKRDEESASKTKRETVVAEQHRHMAEKQTALHRMTEAAEKKYPDFFEKVFNQSPDLVPITPIIGEAILESDIGQDVAYYLGTHPAEAQRLAKLSPTASLREFGKLEAALSKPKSDAPQPINPLGGRKGSDDTKIGGKEDFESFLKKRNKQLGR